MDFNLTVPKGQTKAHPQLCLESSSAGHCLRLGTGQGSSGVGLSSDALAEVQHPVWCSWVRKTQWPHWGPAPPLPIELKP
jgi:hypothetical protein